MPRKRGGQAGNKMRSLDSLYPVSQSLLSRPSLRVYKCMDCFDSVMHRVSGTVICPKCYAKRCAIDPVGMQNRSPLERREALLQYQAQQQSKLKAIGRERDSWNQSA